MNIMAFLLTLLKLLGILLGAFFLLILMVLLILLFLPFHYSASVRHSEEEWEGSFYFSGFLHFWQICYASFESGYEARLYGFWGKIQLYPQKQSRNVQKKRRSKSDDLQTVTEEEIIQENDKTKGDEFSENVNTRADEDRTSENGTIKSSAGKQTSCDKKQQTKSKITGKKRRFLKEKTKRPLNQKSDISKDTIVFLLQKAFWILKQIRPTILEADVDFSLGDPALTGGMTGVLSLCPGVYNEKCSIRPNFNTEDIYLTGKISIKGIVFLWHFVYLIISIYRNKECKTLIFKK